MQQGSIKRVKDLLQLGGKGDLLGIVKKIECWSHDQKEYSQAEICPKKWDA